VSGYLERLAARSVGASVTASALPRQAARLEDPTLGGGGLEVIDEALTEPSAPAVPAHEAPSSEQPSPRRLEPSSVTPVQASRRERLSRMPLRAPSTTRRH